jgi:dipeptidyl aminopeptidase/acylaminoacyl peptidase
MAKTPAPAGAWPSKITSELLTAASIGFGSEVQFDGSGRAFWLEVRPQEKGRSAFGTDGGAELEAKLAPADAASGPAFNVRTRVHEYGGGASVVDGSDIYFSNFADGRVYHQPSDGSAPPRPISPSAGGWRFADFCVARAHGLLVCVAERHGEGQAEPSNTIVALQLAPPADDLEPAPPRELASGAAFYASPRVSPSGRLLAFVSWEHPSMPWDETALWALALDDAAAPVGAPRLLAGSVGKDESVVEPRWLPAAAPAAPPTAAATAAAASAADAPERLVFVSDRSGWWNLYAVAVAADGAPAAAAASLLGRADAAEFARPLWRLCPSQYCALPDGSGRVLAVRSAPEADGDELVLLAPPGSGAEAARLAVPFASIASVSAHADAATGALTVALVGGSADAPSRVALATVADCALLGTATWRKARVAVDAARLPAGVEFSRPAKIQFRSVDDRVAYCWYYPPASAQCCALAGEAPPLIVKSHGGPTSAASAAFNLSIQFWTSRGFAVADVDYGGSSGYGRAFRNSLRGRWGEVDGACVRGDVRVRGSERASECVRSCVRARGTWHTLAACVRARALPSPGPSPPPAPTHIASHRPHLPLRRTSTTPPHPRPAVDDCCAAATHLASAGLADRARLCVTGGSAGGFTTLACLTFRDVFAAGTSHYGVADLKALALETHKFESRYLDSLIGPLPAAEATYAARSPLSHVGRLRTPIALFQGADDKIVPPNQALSMFEAAKANNVPTTCVMCVAPRCAALR